MNRKLKVFLFCFLISFVTLLITSKNSFLYPMNDGVDMNAYFTMGKGFFDGVIPYKDLFDQKGPMVYLVYGIGTLISSTSFIGVFILEILFFSIFLYFSCKIIELLSENVYKYIYILIPLFSLLVTTSESFVHGGSVEEFCLPLVTYTLYLFLKFLKSRIISLYEVIVEGIIAASLILTKYTLVGMSAAFGLILVFLIFKQDGLKSAFKFCLQFLFGMLIVIIPWIIYFAYTNSFKDFIDVYFIINLTAYSSSEGFIESFLDFPNLFFENIISCGFIYLICMVLSFCWLKKYFNDERLSFIYSCILIFITILFIYIGNVMHLYYALILFPFLIGGLIWLFEKLDPMFIKIRKLRYGYIGYFVYYAVLFVLLFKGANYIYFIGTPKESLMQYQFAEIINEKEDATVLEYGWLDVGVYFASGKLPVTRYFVQMNFSYDNFPENHDEQVKYIENGITDFVVVTSNVDTILTDESLPEFFKHYKIVSTVEQLFENKLLRYYLLEKKL